MEGKVFFAWNNAMSVGITEIDSQHKTLVGILNRLCMAVAQFESNRITVEILDALADYTKTHFSLEETLLKDAGYDAAKLDAHQHEHRAFIEKISHIAYTHRAEGKSVSLEILNLLKRWLQDHILIADKEWVGLVSRAMAARHEVAPKHDQWWKVPLPTRIPDS